jgi:hypothetical protein
MTARAAPPRKRFVLSGHSAPLNPTIHAVRGDLADVELADRVFAPHYAKAMRYRTTATTTVHAKPNSESDEVDVLADGDALDLFDLSAGWGWVRTAKGIGYVRADRIAPA